MGYNYTLYDSIEEIDAHAWNRLRWGDKDPLMDPLFILSVERSMADRGKFWYVICRDQDQEPVACAALCLYRPDFTAMTKGWAKKAASVLARVVPRFLQFKMLFCGLPLPPRQSHLRFAPEADFRAVLQMLDDILCKIAVKERASCIIIKGLSAEECERLDALPDLGYLRGNGLPVYHARPDYRNFENYLSSLRSHRRRDIKRSQRKFEQFGLRAVQMTGRDGVDRIFTDDVYQLYEAVYERAKMKLEKLPAAFFHELASHLPDQTAFTFIYDRDRVVAFAVSVFTSSVCHHMFLGFDYELNPKCDLYFNLLYKLMDYSYRQDVSDICVGATADTFKQRKLGCYQRPRVTFISKVSSGWHLSSSIPASTGSSYLTPTAPSILRRTQPDNSSRRRLPPCILARISLQRMFPQKGRDQPQTHFGLLR